jgi:hypothetical protein
MSEAPAAGSRAAGTSNEAWRDAVEEQKQRDEDAVTLAKAQRALRSPW